MDWLKELLKDLPNAADLEKSITEGIGKSFVSKVDFNTANETRKKLERDIKERDTQLETLMKSTGGNAELQKQIQALQDDNKKKDEEYQTALKDLKVTNAIKLAIAGKVHDEDLAAGLFDKTKLILGDDGKVTGLDDQIKGLQESKAFLFKQEETNTGFKFGAGGNGSGGDISSQLAAAFGNDTK